MLKKLKRFLSAATALTMLFSSFGVIQAYADDLAVISDEDGISTLEGADFSIIEQKADQETAMICWNPSDLPNAARYRVSIKSSDGSYTELDDDLIRRYHDYYRADAVGLKGGESYQFKVEVLDKNDESLDEIESQLVKPIAHTREGYAFKDTAYANGETEGIGAYDNNGELKSNADIIYVTEANKDNVPFEVVVDSKGKTETRYGILDILLGLKKGYHPRPIAIRFIGKVTDMANIDSDSNFKGDLCIDLSKKSSAGITLEGIGDDAVAYGWGLRLKNANNIEVRNIAFMDCDSDEGDDVGLQQTNYNIWVHNCDFFYGEAGSDSDQAKGDGSLDCKKSNYVTFSYNHFWDNGKSCLLGLSEKDTELYVTYHHNWFDHSDSRHPRIRYFTTHVYNNYYDGNAKYGVGSTMGSSVFVESNYFKNCKYPMLTSMQGSDIYDTSKRIYDSGNLATFSKEDGGVIKAYDNLLDGKWQRFISYDEMLTLGAGHEGQFDAYVVKDKAEKVPDTVKSLKGNNTYNNFDTEGFFYDYDPTPVEQVPEVVTAYAGRAYKGDFEFPFTDADNELSEVNAALKNRIKSYKSGIVGYGGAHISDSDVVDPDDTTTTKPDDNTTTTTPDDQTSSTETTTETTTDDNSSESSTETTTEEAPVQPAGTGKWDFGNSTFLDYEERNQFVEEENMGDYTVVNGLTIYRPASGVTAKSTTANDGTPLAGYLKINAKSDAPPQRETITDAFKFEAVRGETIKVYACSNTNGKETKIVIADASGADKKVGIHSSNKDVTVTDYVVERSGSFWVYASGEANANIYKIQIVGADNKDATGVNETLVGDVDGDGVLSVNDVMLTFDYAKNTSEASDELKQAIKDAFGSEAVTIETAEKLLDEVLSRK